jgi:hypothetical protein
MKLPKIKLKGKIRWYHKVTWGISALAVFVAFVAVTDFMGLVSTTELQAASAYMVSNGETLNLSRTIKAECGSITNFSEGETPWMCYMNKVWLATPSQHTWLSSPPKRIQWPSETLERQRGNCVDKSVFQATLFRELGFDHVYLVLQPTHMCVMVTSQAGTHFSDCIPDAPIKGLLRVYSDGFD